MPKRVPELTAIQVRRLTRPGFHAVGGVAGLLLQVKPSTTGEGVGPRSWVLRTTVGDKRRAFGLGAYPEVSLASARDKASRLKERIRDGVDPVEERKAAQRALRAAQAKALTFDEAARRCHAARATEFRNEKHRRDWISSLERHASPVLGTLSVAEIDMPHVLAVLEPIWKTRTETATRVRQRIETVLTWATVSGYRSGTNSARWEGNLKEVLPNPSKITKVRHHRAIPWQEIGTFMANLRDRDGMSARALEFAILTAARSGEVRLATWDEMDLEGGVWMVPAERIKAGRTHRVPLSQDAVALLSALPRYEGSPYVFPAQRGGALSDMSLSAVCRRMGVDATPHGFRSTFKDWARNRTRYADEVSELALAHVNSDATRAAYARDELIGKRRRLMAEWASYCNTIEKGEESADVLPMGTASAGE